MWVQLALPTITVCIGLTYLIGFVIAQTRSAGFGVLPYRYETYLFYGAYASVPYFIYSLSYVGLMFAARRIFSDGVLDPLRRGNKTRHLIVIAIVIVIVNTAFWGVGMGIGTANPFGWRVAVQFGIGAAAVFLLITIPLPRGATYVRPMVLGYALVVLVTASITVGESLGESKNEVVIRTLTPWPQYTELENQPHSYRMKFVGTGYNEYFLLDQEGRLVIIPKDSVQSIQSVLTR